MTASDQSASALPSAATPAQGPVRLDIFIDPACPWCYVGKANLDRALANHPEHPFQILWHPFFLNPNLPAEGLLKRPWLEEKFGGKDAVDAMHERLRQVAAEAGVELDPDRPSRVPNTIDAQRLIHWASLEGQQTRVVSDLLRAYWDEGRDIGDHEVLADIAAANGMAREVVLRLLASDADRDDLLARDQDARQKGVSAVPMFLIAQQYVVSGAQPPELWENVITELMEQFE